MKQKEVFMEYILSPSILSANFAKLGEDITAISDAGAKYVHIDVMDGLFVPSISFGFPIIESIRTLTDKIFDVHLMIQEPIRYIERFAKAGADIITVHYEACSNIKETLDAIRTNGCKVGVTIKPATPVSVLYDIMDQVDMVLIMTVEPGFGGQKYIEATTEKIVELRKYITEHQLSVDIEVDGGVNKDTIQTVLDAGANIIVGGTAIFKGNIKENVDYYHNIFKNRLASK